MKINIVGKLFNNLINYLVKNRDQKPTTLPTLFTNKLNIIVMIK